MSRRGVRDALALDGLPWRAAEVAVRVGEAGRRRLARWRRRAVLAWRLRVAGGPAPPSRHPVVRELLALEPAQRNASNRASVRRMVETLRLALQGGADETAAELALAIEPRLDELTVAERTRALPLLVETRLARGERREAEALAAAHRPELAASRPGLSALVLLGDPEAESRIELPGGRLNALGLSRRLAGARLEADELERLLDQHRAALLRSPDLHLLAASAWSGRDPERALAALNRFLRAHGLPAATRSGASENLLADLGFPSSLPAHRGPLVSVIVAAHRAVRTIGYAIDSLLRQTHSNLEVLVGDDASDDGTLALLERRYGTDPRVRIFASASRQGPYNVRNALVDRARGDLVTFHDADDLALPTRLAAQVRRMSAPRVVACYHGFVRVTADGRFVFFRDQSALRLCMASLMTRRETFDAVGRFRPVWFGADLEVHERLLHRHGEEAIPMIRRPLVLGLSSAESATRRPGSESREDGYRSAARRVYADLVFQSLWRGDSAGAEASFAKALAASGNTASPGVIVEQDRAKPRRESSDGPRLA